MIMVRHYPLRRGCCGSTASADTLLRFNQTAVKRSLVLPHGRSHALPQKRSLLLPQKGALLLPQAVHRPRGSGGQGRCTAARAGSQLSLSRNSSRKIAAALEGRLIGS